MIDLKSLFPTVTALIAFIITLCCLFAGTQKNVLNSVNLLTLYTPQGNYTAPSHDFYSIHVLTYCQGTLLPSSPPLGSVSTELSFMDAPHNVTSCSNRTILGSFNPTASWPTDITQGPALLWQRVISDDFHAFQMTSHAMAVLYIVGVGAMGVVLVGKAVSIVVPRTEFGLVEVGFLIVSSLSVSIASIIATVLAFEFVALINAHGFGSNVTARSGEKFLGMTWASAGLLLLGSWMSFKVVLGQGGGSGAPASGKDEEEG